MATSRLDAVLTALHSTFDAEFGDDVLVTDGPFIDMAGEQDTILVGHDGAQDDSSGLSIESEQEWVGIGTQGRRDERVTATCAALTWIGDNDPAIARARVYELVDACEAAISADRTLGVGTVGTPGSVRNALISGLALYQANNVGGAKARVVFTVSCIARL
jgi:hypothetical protein